MIKVSEQVNLPLDANSGLHFAYLTLANDLHGHFILCKLMLGDYEKFFEDSTKEGDEISSKSRLSRKSMLPLTLAETPIPIVSPRR